MVDVGTGFFVEKTTEQAKKFYEAKVEELGKNVKDLESIVQGKNQNLRLIEEGMEESELYYGVFTDTECSHASKGPCKQPGSWKRLRLVITQLLWHRRKPPSLRTLDTKSTTFRAQGSQSTLRYSVLATIDTEGAIA